MSQVVGGISLRERPMQRVTRRSVLLIFLFVACALWIGFNGSSGGSATLVRLSGDEPAAVSRTVSMRSTQPGGFVNVEIGLRRVQTSPLEVRPWLAPTILLSVMASGGVAIGLGILRGNQLQRRERTDGQQATPGGAAQGGVSVDAPQDSDPIPHQLDPRGADAEPAPGSNAGTSADRDAAGTAADPSGSPE